MSGGGWEEWEEEPESDECGERSSFLVEQSGGEVRGLVGTGGRADGQAESPVSLRSLDCCAPKCMLIFWSVFGASPELESCSTSGLPRRLRKLSEG